MSVTTLPERMCISCMDVKPRTAEFWRKLKGCKDGLEPRICSQCCNEERLDIEKRKAMDAEVMPVAPLPQRRTIKTRKTVSTRATKLPSNPKRDVHHSQHVGTKLCALCHGMAHRVEGESCKRCGLRAAAEPKPEMQLRKFG